MTDQTQRWIAQDKAHVWHPFTQQADWCAEVHFPIVLERGEGVWLFDTEGRRYLDGNSSIWTNIHGHGHPAINAAIRAQLKKVAHTSFLGTTHPLACELAERLTQLLPGSPLSRVFYSDNGSTALECAFKMELQYRELIGEPERDTFIVFENAYHGDTLGASSLGGVARFTSAARKRGFKSHVVSSLVDLTGIDTTTIAATVIEPLVQGVNEMHMWPAGMLRNLRQWCDDHGIHLILDEVMTGFGRTGRMFACQHEDVVPDYLCLAKGLTGGYSPLAATMVAKKIYEAFLGSPDRTFYYGHSYTAHPLGCAAALANLDLFDSEQTLANVSERSAQLSAGLRQLEANHSSIVTTRQIGLIAAITIDPGQLPMLDLIELCRENGLLTRPILNSLVILPPLCIRSEEIVFLLEILDRSLAELSLRS